MAINKTAIALSSLLFAATLNGAAAKTIFLVTRNKAPWYTTYTKHSTKGNYSAAFYINDNKTYGGYDITRTRYGAMRVIIHPVMAKQRYKVLDLLWKQQRKTK